MNIDTIRNNLKNTISGKELLYSNKNFDNPYTTMYMDEIEVAVWNTTKEYLRLNINELKRILLDIESIK